MSLGRILPNELKKGGTMKGFGMSSRRAIFVLLLGLGFGLVSLPTMAQNYVPATSSTCDLGDITDAHDTTRFNPEWAPINIDADHPLPNNVPNILEGFVAPVPSTENQNSQAPAEVSEEEIPWNHYTHDYTFKVVPDSTYQYLLSSWTRFPNDVIVTLPGSDAEAQAVCTAPYGFGGLGGTYQGNNRCLLYSGETCPDQTKGDSCHHPDMEVEWENGSVMHVNSDSANNTRKWGALPEYAWPSVGDRVWLEGRWIFDCGHTGMNDGLSKLNDLGLLPSGTTLNDWVKFESEIHPPRALATFRLGHTSMSQEQTNSSGDPYRAQSDEPSSWLPVTGTAFPQQNGTPPWTPPTLIPVTEADIFVSGNGGGANDLCNIVNRSDSSGDCSPYSHTGPAITINNYNYVFDIYPPGTNYAAQETNGTFKVSPPTPDSSLQWRILDHSDLIPEHTCGPDKTYCKAADPILCLIGASTPPTPGDPVSQTNLGTSCPGLQPGETPTRLRVILPFYTDTLPPPQGNNQNDTYFAQSILLGWDDVPDGQERPAMRRRGVTLEEFKVNQNGRCTICGDGDWRVFIDVAGQWRWISWLYDTNNGIYAFDGGDNSGHGDPLTENGDDDFYHFTKTPWTVDVVDGRTIHVAVGGFDSGPSDGGYCDSYSGSGCDYSAWSTIFHLGIADVIALARVGTYEFDLYPGDCANECTVEIPETETERQYTTTFKTFEIDAATPPAATLAIGDPQYNGFVSSATPFTLSSSDLGVQGFQYRFHEQGGPLPTYATSPFPIHWTSANLSGGASSLSVYLNGASDIGDGPYDFQYAAQSIWNLLEPRHTSSVTLDTTPPVATITQPAATQYGHNVTLTLGYSVSDGSGSGVKSFTPKMDGETASQFCAASNPNCLDSGQPIYLISMSLGTHTFSVDSVDNVNNAGTNSVIFTITVTFDSLKGDVNDLVSLGCIDNISQSLLSKISAAQNLNGKGQTQAAINTLSALINEVQAQAGKHISTTCTDPSGRPFNPVQLLIGDAQYLQGTLGQLKPNPVIGSVLNSNNVGINGLTVNLVNSSKTVIATATTDSVGLFYFADTSGLTVGANYTVKVTLPKGYKSSTPASQAFTWNAVGVALSNFVLN